MCVCDCVFVPRTVTIGRTVCLYVPMYIWIYLRCVTWCFRTDRARARMPTKTFVPVPPSSLLISSHTQPNSGSVGWTTVSLLNRAIEVVVVVVVVVPRAFPTMTLRLSSASTPRSSCGHVVLDRLIHDPSLSTIRKKNCVSHRCDRHRRGHVDMYHALFCQCYCKCVYVF
jgi:hypothetical protein